jgi:murein DD-endopeptidase MepM/ murein hydrolase activator NlpD
MNPEDENTYEQEQNSNSESTTPDTEADFPEMTESQNVEDTTAGQPIPDLTENQEEAESQPEETEPPQTVTEVVEASAATPEEKGSIAETAPEGEEEKVVAEVIESEGDSDTGELPEVNAEIVESETDTNPEVTANEVNELRQQLEALQGQREELAAEITNLQGEKSQLTDQISKMQQDLGQMVEAGLETLQQRQQSLQASVEQLERRRDRVRQEMRTTFAGASQELAIRVQGFKDYLVGSLQDLAAAAEQLELPRETDWEAAPPPQQAPQREPEAGLTPQFAKQAFKEQIRQIRDIIDQYRNLPDYYGPPWQLRRTFEPIHAEKVESWFFTQGGRGAIESMGSRLQNILVASAIISIAKQLYGDRLRTLVLANSPERLGEWRRGLQDCLGISRVDFGPERGVVLFENPEATAQKAERLLQERQLPLIVIDSTDDQVSLGLLKFPLWLAFAPDPQQASSYLY